MIRFAHVADTHLGASNFKLEEREQDFLSAFQQFIDKCVEEKLDFVVHSGDVFDMPKPKNRILVFVVEQLRKLKEEGIPFFTIPGSHDTGVDGTFLSVLEKVGLLTNLGNPRYFEKKEGSITLKGEVCKNVFLAGMPGRRAGIKDVYRVLKPEFQEAKLKVFVFHHTVSDANAFFPDINTSLLPKGFDYYAGGHWHKRFETVFNNAPIVYPGSLENCDIREMNYGQRKGFFIVEFDEKLKYYLEPIKARRVEWVEINCNGLSPEEVEKKCREKMVKASDKPLLVLKLKGRLSKGSRSEINKSKLLELAINEGYLHAHTSTSDLSNPATDLDLTIRNKSVETIEHEYLTKKGFKENELEIAKKIINLLGREMRPSEIQAAQKTIAEEVEKIFGI